MFVTDLCILSPAWSRFACKCLCAIFCKRKGIANVFVQSFAKKKEYFTDTIFFFIAFNYTKVACYLACAIPFLAKLFHSRIPKHTKAICSAPCSLTEIFASLIFFYRSGIPRLKSSTSDDSQEGIKFPIS